MPNDGKSSVDRHTEVSNELLHSLYDLADGLIGKGVRETAVRGAVTNLSPSDFSSGVKRLSQKGFIKTTEVHQIDDPIYMLTETGIDRVEKIQQEKEARTNLPSQVPDNIVNDLRNSVIGSLNQGGNNTVDKLTQRVELGAPVHEKPKKKPSFLERIMSFFLELNRSWKAFIGFLALISSSGALMKCLHPVPTETPTTTTPVTFPSLLSPITITRAEIENSILALHHTQDGLRRDAGDMDSQLNTWQLQSIAVGDMIKAAIRENRSTSSFISDAAALQSKIDQMSSQRNVLKVQIKKNDDQIAELESELAKMR